MKAPEIKKFTATEGLVCNKPNWASNCRQVVSRLKPPWFPCLGWEQTARAVGAS